MAAGTFTWYNTGRRDALCEGNWATDDHYAVLLGAGYTPSAAHATLADISASEIADGDYARQDITGESIALHSDPTKVKLDANIINFGDPVTISAKYVAIVMGTVAGAAGTNELVGYMDLNTESGAAVLASTNDNYAVDFDATAGVTLVG